MKSSQRAGTKNEQQEDAVLQEGELKNKHFLLRVRKLLTLSCLCSSVDKKKCSTYTHFLSCSLLSLHREKEKRSAVLCYKPGNEKVLSLVNFFPFNKNRKCYACSVVC